MSKKDYLTVEELNFFINNIINEETLLHSVPVVGEVSGCSYVSGHCYFTLKDKKAQIKVVFFSCPANKVPLNGQNVLIRGSVDYYVKNGQISVKAFEITPFGSGELYIELEKLKQKLTAEGIFDETRKKEIPKYCKRVALITSAQGAAMQDFLSTLSRNQCPISVSVIDVRVQGENSVNDVIEALTNADEYGFDVIIIARGGGSFEDLYGFNDERLLRKIYDMKTPVISAVGHETDYTLADFVADYRAITPTAAAEKISYSLTDLKNIIIKYVQDMGYYIKNNYYKKSQKLTNNLNILQNKTNVMLANQYNIIKNSLNMIKIYCLHNYEAKNAKIQEILLRMDSLSPTKLLNNGYFRILKDNNMIFDGSKIDVNDEISIVGANVKLTAKVTNKEGK